MEQPTRTYDAIKLLENSYFMEWISSLHQVQNNQAIILHQQKNDDQDKENLPLIFCRIPCAGTQDDRLVKNLAKKLKQKNFSEQLSQII